MWDFKAKLPQIRFRLGLHPRPHWGSLQRSCWGRGSLQRSPDTLAGFVGAALQQGGKGMGGQTEGKGKGREGKREEGKWHTLLLLSLGAKNPSYATIVQFDNRNQVATG